MLNIRIVYFRVVVFELMFLLLAACVYEPNNAPYSHRHIDFYPYDYYYYPNARVYFHFTTGYYHYLDNKRWVKSRTLLPRIHLDPRDRVRLRIDTDQPFVKHPEHLRKYRPLPGYRHDAKMNIKEREENRQIYQEYKKMKDQNKKTERRH